MNNFEIFLEQESKDWLYRKDGSLLADLQYNMYLLTFRIENMLSISSYIRIHERTEDFSNYKDDYFRVLNEVLSNFSQIVRKKEPIDQKFVNSINNDVKFLWKNYNDKIKNLNEQEAKAVNDLLFAYQILLRVINTYIISNNFDVELLNIFEPLIYDFEPDNYLNFLYDFVKSQKIIKLED